jgi:restriction system protein
MSIPDYQQAMLPVLQVLAAGAPKGRRLIVSEVADHFGLSAAELSELLPSGKAPVILSRVGWALTYLKQAGLVETPKRGLYQLTDRGRETLRQPPPTLNNDYLERFQEFRDFLERGRASTIAEQATPAATPTDSSSPLASPEEALETAYARLRAGVEAELLEAIKRGSPVFFEQLVIDLLVQMGYGGSHREAARAVGRTGDGGIDGVIDEDRLGLDTIYVQAKRWEASVGRPEVQKFAGALQGQRAKKGILITTSVFSREAEEYAQRIDTRIVLVDGRRLTSLLFDHDVGVSPHAAYTVKQLDGDYFEES